MAHTLGRLSAGALLASFLWLGLTHASGAVKESKSEKSKSGKKSEAAETAKVSFRLPRYFASIIDDEQRSEIQEIQASYHDKIVALQQELDELEAAQLKKMEGVLTAAQRKTLDEMRSGSSKGGSGTSKSSPAKASGSSKKSAKSKSTSSSKTARKSSSGDD